MNIHVKLPKSNASSRLAERATLFDPSGDAVVANVGTIQYSQVCTVY